MLKPRISQKEQPVPIGADFFERRWEESWTYIKTVVDMVHEPVLILDERLRVLAANDPFFAMFGTGSSDTIGRSVYELGNGQWDIPDLRKLLEDILPKHTYFKGFEVTHAFPQIGRKTMLLNARRLHFDGEAGPAALPRIIVLAIEDVTELIAVAEDVARRMAAM